MTTFLFLCGHPAKMIVRFSVSVATRFCRFDYSDAYTVSLRFGQMKAMMMILCAFKHQMNPASRCLGFMLLFFICSFSFFVSSALFIVFFYFNIFMNYMLEIQSSNVTFYFLPVVTLLLFGLSRSILVETKWLLAGKESVFQSFNFKFIWVFLPSTKTQVFRK